MTSAAGPAEPSRPEWFAAFLADRGTRKPSAHTMKAYRQDFDAIATLVTGETAAVAQMPLADITTDSIRTAFAQYAETHEAASIQRCWSTWNALCTFLYTAQLIAANPMPLVGRPKLAKTLPKALPTDSLVALLAILEETPRRRRTDWIERDHALILTALLAGLRADELLRANVGDLRRTKDGAVIHVRGKGGRNRRVPIEAPLVDGPRGLSRQSRGPLPDHGKEALLPRRGIGRLSPSGTAVCRRRWGADLARHLAISGAARVSPRRHRRRSCPRSPRSRTTPHLRHRARQLRGQRLHPHAAARPRIHGDLTA